MSLNLVSFELYIIRPTFLQFLPFLTGPFVQVWHRQIHLKLNSENLADEEEQPVSLSCAMGSLPVCTRAMSWWKRICFWSKCCCSTCPVNWHNIRHRYLATKPIRCQLYQKSVSTNLLIDRSIFVFFGDKSSQEIHNFDGCFPSQFLQRINVSTTIIKWLENELPTNVIVQNLFS